ncbi:PQQ-dependent sugar dehydrogenase [Luteolibacter flavescens]|uniref:PQQ-dependent sugar dehydrogenase n=1 Tax=Luteolibacter flavescens TaxID=1859460 RepID=A0ABT3FK04_9BACT|nr:PQQ-dependent sugar dehydrogenase [Luteolibacter flavescens]MCW1883777.1 PQQ-dependent sugar dehydrogenase [Luteolibacter flavescens]
MLRKPIFLIALLASAQGQNVTHRWTFNSTGAATNGTVIPDAISAAPATIVGTGAARNGTTITLPGTTNGNASAVNISAYVDLPNGIISSKTNLTVEVWATPVSTKTWQRLFDFGTMNTAGTGEISNTSGAPGGGTNSRDNLMLSISRDGGLNNQRLAARNDGGGELGVNNAINTTLGSRYHYVLTFQSGVGANAATGGRLTWYRDGGQMATLDTDFRLHQLSDLNNWLGRSQFTDDSNANISYDEVRLYDHVLTPSQISANALAGPNTNFPAPAVTADAVTMLHGTKARVNVLANDSGEIVRSTMTIDTPPTSGTATVSSDGSILYTHTTGTPAGDSFIYRISNSTGQSSTGTVTVSFSNSLKFANPAIQVPAAAPATAYALPNALGSLTFTQPVCLATPPGETQRLFVVEKTGIIRVVNDVSATAPTSSVFLNLKQLVDARGNEDFVNNTNLGDEHGLLGLAFHPNHAMNRQFYVFYSLLKSGTLYQRVSRFTTMDGNTNVADTSSEEILIDQLDQEPNHNGGDLHFGPDGYLYISVGDEGAANDTRLNSQLINKDLFSGILRIDVDRNMTTSIEPTAHAAIPTPAKFAIPKTNPYVLTAEGGDWNGQYNGSNVTGTVRKEFWATGLRNPWRMSFDPVTGTLWCGDVGQGAREEINIITRKSNYGWVYREGTITGPRTNNPTMPANFDSAYHVPPISEYPRSDGYSVTGGRVYRGTRIAPLTGKYVFADYGSGNIWAMDLTGANRQRIASEAGISAFGVDPSNGDLLLADLADGVVRRLTTTTNLTGYPATLSATGLFADLGDLSPSPGLVPYDVNLLFWSDHAIKRRWMVVPNGTSQFTWSKDGLWTLPAGTIWVKHFDMEMQRGVPASKKRIETRLLVKNAGGAYGVSYRWNEAGTEATLVEDGGVNFPLNVTENGNPAPQTWRIPSRAECMICHTPQAGHALSFNTRQLNLSSDMAGFSGNQLTTLRQQGYLSNDPGSPNLLPRHVRPDESTVSLEARVRSYLDVNCSYCHKAGGTAPASWDGRSELTLGLTNLVNGTASNNGGNSSNRLVVPGNTANSIVLHRMAMTSGFTRMPPLATNVIDSANVTLLTNWINGELANRQTYDEWRTSNFEPANNPLGEPTVDADGDGISNHDEFLAGTDPNNGSSAFRPLISTAPPKLGFTLPANRSYRIDTSTDLNQWMPWDIPQNQGLPVPGGLIEIPFPVADPRQFFRIELREN